ncbi:hypothetical protein AVDCRST_MAG94-2549 [uncultured Leptolyngbya sp.]|uniref:Uncharacterized protein n=1 Tax=uncultured Leptolyngbya sp. TaxID=332963 RepID=A0A6J4M041_9CYAN|nr:hypothetical protein AVDCRST_MAG94-2549 [uncultured Leptolyngbya sp.]
MHLNKSSRHDQETVAFWQLAVSANGLMNGFQPALETVGGEVWKSKVNVRSLKPSAYSN